MSGKIKQICAVLMVCLMAASVAATAVGHSDADIAEVDTSWFDASKTEFTLTTAAQLRGLATVAGTPFISGKTFFLGNDVDMGATDSTGTNMKIIGEGSFNATFDGRGHKISGIVMKAHEGSLRMGLFGTVEGTVKDLSISITITGPANIAVSAEDNFIMAGCLAGEVNGGIISGCHVEAGSSISLKTTAVDGCGGGYISAGGLVGQISMSSVTNCGSSATIDAYGSKSANVGGLTGTSYQRAGDKNEINNSYATGTIKAQGDNQVYVGGLAGVAFYALIKNSISNMGFDVSGGAGGRALGGFIGSAVGDKSLAECYWSHTGAVEPTDGIGSTGEAVNKMHLDEGVWIADGYMGSLVDILNSYVSDNVNPADPLRRYVKWTHSDAILIHGTTLVNVVKGGVNYPAWIGLNDSALSFKDAAPPESDFGYNLRLDGKVHKAAGKNVSLAEIDGYFAQSSGWSYKGSFLTFNEIKEYSVSISIKGNGSVSVDGTKAAENNSWAEPNTTVVKVKDDGSSNLLEFTAASARYEFSLLTVNDVDVTCGPYSLNGINADTTVSAQFKQVQFTVTYQFTNTAPSGTALPEPVNTEYEGVVNLTRPTVPTGYSFSGWSFEDEVAASVKVTYDVTVTGSWTHNQWEVTYTWTNPLLRARLCQTARCCRMGTQANTIRTL